MITEKSYVKMSCDVYDGMLTIYSIPVRCTNVFMICAPVFLTYKSADPLPSPPGAQFQIVLGGAAAPPTRYSIQSKAY